MTSAIDAARAAQRATRPNVELEVARTNAAYYLNRYLDHHGDCSVAPIRRCDECEQRGLDMVAAARHATRLEAAS